MQDAYSPAIDTEWLTGRWLLLLGIVGTPLLLYLALAGGVIYDPVWASPFMHFYIVSIIALVALAMAGFMAAAALQLKDARLLFLAFAYLSSATSLTIHALTTPGVLVEFNPWVGFCGDLGVLLAAFFIALASLGWSPGFQRRIVARGRVLLWSLSIVLAAFLALTMTSSFFGFAGSFGFLVDERLEKPSIWLTYLLLWFSTFRLTMLYKRHSGPVLFAMLASVAFLIETVISMTNSGLWLASWWLHHGLLLAAFVVVVVGIGLQYRRRSTMRGVLEGLLLRDSLTLVEREYTDTIIALVAAVEARDPYTHGHSSSVARISEQLGARLGLKGEALETLHLSALLHDIGKIGIPDHILLKPGKLTDEEFDKIREHPGRGEQIVSKISALRACLPGIRHHHERLDGSGYPDRLCGDAISLDARIIAVADSFDAMTSDRPYRGPMSHEQALAIIRAEAGVKLDGRVVTALLDIVGREREPSVQTESPALAAD